MDAAPFVTICIVTGRRIPLLDACLASLQAQVDPPRFELLVCSDGDADVAHAVRDRFPDARIRTVARAYRARLATSCSTTRGASGCCSSTTT